MIRKKFKIQNAGRPGIALLVVLFIVMVITVLSLGYLSRSDVELACGENMILRTQMDYLAESGLEHARGLILNPQDVPSEYWTGGIGQQIAGGNDYYDICVVRDNSDPTDRCNYVIDCNSYRLRTGEKIGQSTIRAQLRLDPCIALWTGANATLWNSFAVYGDVYCNGNLTNQGTIDGDVFASVLTGSITGQKYAVADLSLAWPSVKVTDFTSRYSYGSLSGQTFGPYDPPRVCYSSDNLTLPGNVRIEGMLLVGSVDGSALPRNLTIRGTNNVIVAGKNLPALYVTGDLIIEGGASLDVNGLAVVGSRVLMNANTCKLNTLGGLFVQNTFAETASDSSSYSHTLIPYNGPTWRPSGGYRNGAAEFDGVNDKFEDSTAPAYLNGLSSITVSLWVKSNVTYEDRDIFFTRTPTDSDEELGIRYDRDGAYGGAVRNIKASIRATSGYTQIESSSNVQTTSWQHLAIVWQSGSRLKLYINGSLNMPTYDLGPVYGTITGVQKFMLGVGTKSRYWKGLIDDVRIYNRALDPNDIYPPKDGLAGLLAHWNLDETGIPAVPVTITAAPSKTAVVVWSQTGQRQYWGQAAGAFFRSIQRK